MDHIDIIDRIKRMDNLHDKLGKEIEEYLNLAKYDHELDKMCMVLISDILRIEGDIIKEWQEDSHREFQSHIKKGSKFE